MNDHPFYESFNKLENVSLEDLEKNIEAGIYGPPDSHKMKAAKYLVEKHKKNQQEDKFNKDFELTKENVNATKQMAIETKSLAKATWVLVMLTLMTVLLNSCRNHYASKPTQGCSCPHCRLE